MKLVLEINLGNDAMRYYGHLSEIAQKLMRDFDKLEDEGREPADGDGRVVFDGNGNRVGAWMVGPWKVTQ